MAEPKITKLELVFFEHEVRDLGRDYNGFNSVYEKGAVTKGRPAVIRVHTNTGIVGEDLAKGGNPAARLGSIANYLLGKNPFEREKIYNDMQQIRGFGNAM